LTSITVFGIGAVLGGSLFLGGLSTDPEPVSAAARRELADHYNQELRRQLGLAIIAHGDGGGFAMNTRF